MNAPADSTTKTAGPCRTLNTQDVFIWATWVKYTSARLFQPSMGAQDERIGGLIIHEQTQQETKITAEHSLIII